LPITGLPKRRFIKIEREEKRKMGLKLNLKTRRKEKDGKKANRGKEKERVEHVQGTGISNLCLIIL
jgi:hypothetical protein